MDWTKARNYKRIHPNANLILQWSFGFETFEVKMEADKSDVESLYHLAESLVKEHEIKKDLVMKSKGVKDEKKYNSLTLCRIIFEGESFYTDLLYGFTVRGQNPTTEKRHKAKHIIPIVRTRYPKEKKNERTRN